MRNEPLLNISGLAQVLGISVALVGKWLRRYHDLPRIRDGRRTYFVESRVRIFLESLNKEPLPTRPDLRKPAER